MTVNGYFPSPKIKGKHNLNRYMRDVYAGFSTRLDVPIQTKNEELSKKSTVDISYEKKMGKRRGYYRYYYYVAKTSKKPSVFFASPHPVMMQREKKRGWL
jgi:hypothetical protein